MRSHTAECLGSRRIPSDHSHAALLCGTEGSLPPGWCPPLVLSPRPLTGFLMAVTAFSPSLPLNSSHPLQFPILCSPSSASLSWTRNGDGLLLRFETSHNRCGCCGCGFNGPFFIPRTSLIVAGLFFFYPAPNVAPPARFCVLFGDNFPPPRPPPLY